MHTDPDAADRRAPRRLPVVALIVVFLSSAFAMVARAQTPDLHAPFDVLLQRYVATDGAGLARVDYARWKASAEDAVALQSYLAALASARPSAMAPDARMAFFINTYNALTLSVVLDHYPVGSIRDISISPGLFSVGPWKKELIEIEGERLSLDDIEIRKLLEVWRDPRIHYAVNCASVGCPNLAARSYRAETLDAMLAEAARNYINSPRGVVIMRGKLTVSRIYSWYADDFGGSDEAIIAHLKLYAAPELKAALDGVSSIGSTFYDWSLNGQKGN